MSEALHALDARCESLLRRHRAPFLLLVLAAGLALAWKCRFVQDDAFISFTYARSLVRGQGPTWFGARVEGYTNPLWVLWIACGLALGADPIRWSWLGGLLSLAATVLALGRLGARLLDRTLAAGLALLLFVTNFSVLAYGTGGLATMLQTALLSWTAVLADRLHRTGERAGRAAAGLSLLLAAAVLTRLDSALPGVILVAWGALGMWRRTTPARAWLALTGPFALLVGSWLAWKVAYYGQILPNTFYAKADMSPAMLKNGVRYVLRFLHWYALWPFLAAGAAALAVRRRSLDARLVPLVLVTLSWLGYVALVGGDFMEFRFLVPIAPALFLTLAALVCDGVAPLLKAPRAAVAAATLAVLVAASVHHAVSFQKGTPDSTLDSVPQLATFYGVYPDRNWSTIGDSLRTELAGTDPLIALQPVGAIPYYSGLRTVDQLGLTDPEVALHGLRADAWHRRPGHQRRATLQYLERRRVNLVIGHPILVPLDSFGPRAAPAEQSALARRWLAGTLEFERRPVSEARLVLLPVRPGMGLVAWYLTRTPALDARILDRGFPVRRFVLAPGGGAAD